MKIVVLDGYTENPGDLSWDAFSALGELSVYDRTPIDDVAGIVHRIGQAEIVLTNKTPISRAVLDACPTVRYVGVLATGYNVVDVAYAAEKNVTVTNVPAYGTMSVAQFAIALLLEMCSRVGQHDGSVHAGKWQTSRDFCYWDAPLTELDGKTLGIIGFGRIGRQTGRIAGVMGMHVLATGSRPTDEGKAIAEYVDLDTLLRRSDVIALHCPQLPETAGIINRANIAKMKDGVMLVNNARGGLIVEQDLADALNSGKVACAAVDVASSEPICADNPLLHAKNCIITPHISWVTKESRERIMATAADNLRAFLAGAPVNTVGR